LTLSGLAADEADLQAVRSALRADLPEPFKLADHIKAPAPLVVPPAPPPLPLPAELLSPPPAAAEAPPVVAFSGPPPPPPPPLPAELAAPSGADKPAHTVCPAREARGPGP